MIVAEVVEGQSAGQRAGIPNFEAVGQEADFDGGVAVVIAMGNGIDDGFGDGVGRQFIGGGGGDADGAGAHGAVDFREDEVPGLVGLLEEVAAVNLLGGKRAAVFSAVA